MAYCNQNYYRCLLLYLNSKNVQVDLINCASDNKVELVAVGDSIQILKWEYNVPQPTSEQLSAYTENDYKAALLAQKLAAFEYTMQNLHTNEPKFDLVYSMIEEVCKEKLGMNDTEFKQLCANVWEKWAMKT